MPLFVGLTWCIVAFFFALKGGPALNSEYKVYDKNDDGSKDIRVEVLPAVIGIALGVGGFCAIVSVFLFTLNPKFDAYCRKTEEEEMAEAKAAAEAKVASGGASHLRSQESAQVSRLLFDIFGNQNQ